MPAVIYLQAEKFANPNLILYFIILYREGKMVGQGGESQIERES